MVDKLEHYLFLMRDRLSRVWCFQSVWGSRPGRREDKPTFGRSLICLTHFLTFGKYYWRRHENIIVCLSNFFSVHYCRPILGQFLCSWL